LHMTTSLLSTNDFVRAHRHHRATRWEVLIFQ